VSGVKLGGRESDLTKYSGVWFGHYGALRLCGPSAHVVALGLTDALRLTDALG
jgi:hypothetical protein